MKIEITQSNFMQYIINVLSPILQDTALENGIVYRTRQYYDVGFHYIGDWNNETECWNYLQKILIPVGQNINVYARYYDKHKHFIPVISQKDAEQYTHTNNSSAVAEIAPITEAIGDIKTPSSKTKVNGGYTTNVEKSYTNKEIEVLDYINTHSTFLDTVAEMIANCVIAEYNEMY